jgi:hypothetical protein
MIAMKPEVKTNTDCARFCVKERGGRFVLQTKDKVYKLDAQVLAEQWAGLTVKVIGTLDPKTDVISVRSIEAFSLTASKAPAPNETKRSESSRPKTPPPSIAVAGKRNHYQWRHESGDCPC